MIVDKTAGRTPSHVAAGKWIRDIVDGRPPTGVPTYSGDLIEAWLELGPSESSPRGPDAGQRAAPSSDAVEGVNGGWWPRVLCAGGGGPPLGVLLATHPDANRLTRELLADLTVKKLLLVANVQYNKCRVASIPSSLSEERRAEIAWSRLKTGVATTRMHPGTAWTDAETLLTDDAERALERIQGLSIQHVIAICNRIIGGPYRHAAARRKRHSST
jgi:hypothetical protein